MSRRYLLTIFSKDYKCNSLAIKPAKFPLPSLSALLYSPEDVRLSQAVLSQSNPAHVALSHPLETAMYLVRLHGAASCISLSGTILKKHLISNWTFLSINKTKGILSGKVILPLLNYSKCCNCSVLSSEALIWILFRKKKYNNLLCYFPNIGTKLLSIFCKSKCSKRTYIWEISALI